MKQRKYAVTIIFATVALVLCLGAVAVVGMVKNNSVRDADVSYVYYEDNAVPRSKEERDKAFRLMMEQRLGETIETLDGVQEALVTISDRNGDTPIASVLVQMEYENAKLTQEQVVAIQKQLAGSVDGLTEDNISIIDTEGNLYKI